MVAYPTSLIIGRKVALFQKANQKSKIRSSGNLTPVIKTTHTMNRSIIPFVSCSLKIASSAVDPTRRMSNPTPTEYDIQAIAF